MISMVRSELKVKFYTEPNLHYEDHVEPIS